MISPNRIATTISFLFFAVVTFALPFTDAFGSELNAEKTFLRFAVAAAVFFTIALAVFFWPRPIPFLERNWYR